MNYLYVNHKDFFFLYKIIVFTAIGSLHVGEEATLLPREIISQTIIRPLPAQLRNIIRLHPIPRHFVACTQIQIQ